MVGDWASYLAREGEVLGFEMSTPGLRGQSGGAAFDGEGQGKLEEGSVTEKLDWGLRAQETAMAERIEVQGKGITIVSRAQQDYISLTDIAKYRNSDAPADIV